MYVEARSQKIENVLKKGKFVIPDYQREYDWDSAEIAEFLDDIKELKANESYFIGHMVFEGEFNSNNFNVIDGQQRITTITIMLCVIRDIFYYRKEKDLAEGINENYIFGKDKKNQLYIILENKMPYPILQTYVQSIFNEKDLSKKPIKSGEKRIVKVYDYFKDIFEKYTNADLEDLRDKILNLEIIFVAVSDEVDAFTIFETLNATGKDLTPLDLIKNQIFKLYTRQPQLDEPNDSWKEILSNIGNKQLKFLNNFWSSRYKKVSNQKIYKNFINTIIKEKYDIKLFLEDLKDTSVLFRKIINPQEQDWDAQKEYNVFNSLNAIVNVFKIEVANPILLGLLRAYEKENISLKYLLKALNSIERYHFINNAINSNRSSGLDTMYARFARDILVANNKQLKHSEIDKMVQTLEARTPPKEEYEALFNNKVYYGSNDTKQKKMVQYILKKIEMQKQKGNVKLINMSLEHIYPEKPNKDWGKIDGELIINIGNIILLDADLNSKIGNKDFRTKKKAVIKQSTILSTKEIFKKKEVWTENEIKKRSKDIIETMYNNIWK